MGTVNIREERIEFTAVDKSLTSVSRQGQAAVNQLRSSVDTLKNAAQAIVVGTGAFSFGSAMVREAMQAEQASNRLIAVLRATGHAAGLTKGDLDAMADSMHEATQFDDESIRGAQASLLKFGNIYGSVFKEALKLSADLAAFMGTSIPEAAQTVGKSLQSPTDGLRAMTQILGKLSPEQEKNIENLVRQNRAIEAQNAVLDLWRSKIGGTAALMNTGLTAATTGVSKSWNEMLENFGKTADQAGLVERSLRGLTAVMNDLANAGKPVNQVLMQQQGLANLNNRIEVLTRDLAERRIQRRAYGGANVADDPTFAADQARIDQLRSLAQQQARRIQVLGMVGDPSTFDARDLRLRQTPPVVLGGKTTNEPKGLSPYQSAVLQMRQQAAKAEMGDSEFISTQLEIQAGKYKDLTAAQKQNLLVLAAQRDVQKSVREQLDEDKKGREESAKAINEENEKLVESANRYRDLVDPLRQYQRQLAELEELRRRGLLNSEEEIDAYVRVLELLDEARIKQEGLNEATKDSKNAFAEMGFTASSALEDLIVNGGKAGDVMKALAKDLARILFRKTIGNNLSTGVDKFLEGLFKPAGASSAGGVDEAGFSSISEAQWLGNNARGGDYVVGGSGGIDSQMVAFRGTPGERVSITPQGKSGGGTFIIDARGADPAGLARLEGLIVQLHGSIERRAVSAVIANAQRGGAVARALGAA